MMDQLINAPRQKFPDRIVENTAIEVKVSVRAIQQVRASVLQLAYYINKNQLSYGFLVLVQPEIIPKRLEEEQCQLRSVLHPHLADRIHIIVAANGEFSGLPANTSKLVHASIEQMVQDVSSPKGDFLQRPDFGFVIRQVLIHQFLQHAGPMTTKELMKIAGCSYPTAVNVVRQLGLNLKKKSSRQIELRRFPLDDWGKMVANSQKARHTLRFIDRSGTPRSTDQLLRRVRKLDRSDIAIGGILAARHYDPGFDLIGTPRLDLSIHAPHKAIDLTFVEQLDPALTPVDESSKPANLVIHFIRRPFSFFTLDEQGWRWADPVECLLDLHEVRLETQAAEFLTFLMSPNGYKP